MHLAGSGVGKICIIDNDIVDEQNLHRQVIHNVNNIGMNKALSAKKFVNLLNPNIKVIALNESFTNKNGLKLSENYDIIIDYCDTPKTRFLYNDIAVLLNKSVISATVIRLDGHI